MLYSDYNLKNIYSSYLETSESESPQPFRQCFSDAEKIQVQGSWSSVIKDAIDSVASFDPSIREKGEISLKEERRFFGGLSK